ncbi:hypothetical protein N7466_011523 [Penicillium verhagenii]|uniref:uncharacterized protein n=1 Tax=Penicillium verhagenii TaxID=1562060 RepID=UPI002544FC4F|nr:uncharacterized protein N7466_011523 [Penicillium verhagenii]KAJ5915590.1 hypothetical protein N7466_011523 [Penicillium verhagenii]
MIEAKTRHVDWSDVDEDTFTRLCEFAYLRDYTPPTARLIDGSYTPPTARLITGSSPSTKAKKAARKKKKSRSDFNWNWAVRPAEPEAEPEPTEYPREAEPEMPPLEAEPEMPMPPPGSEPDVSPPEVACDDPEIPYKERSVWTRQLCGTFEQSLVVPSSHPTDSNYAFKPPQNTGSWEDFTPVFLEQARLYVLADKYGIDSLCELVLSKLHRTLASFKLYDTGVSGVIELVRFVYMNTRPSYGENIDAMRNFVTRYVVSVLGQIGENAYFRELLEDGGPFVNDFWKIIWGIDNNSGAPQ